MRCGNCGYGSSAQYGRRANKYGYDGSGCSGAMSDTEYDNDVSDDDDAWMVEAAVPPTAERFRSQTAHDRRFLPQQRNRSAPGPPNRLITQPVQASLKFHNDSFDGDSVCSGTFTIDLSTLQKMQARQQTRTVTQVKQSDQFSGPRNSRRPRSYSSLSVNDPAPIPQRPEPAYRAPYSHPHSQHVVASDHEHQPYFPGGHHQFHDDPRRYPVPRNQCNVPDAGGTSYGPHQHRRDHSGFERNPYGYDNSSYNIVQDDHRAQAHDCHNCAGCRHPTATDMDQARIDEYRRPLRFDDGFPDGGRRDERGELENAVVPCRSAAPVYRCPPGTHVHDRHEEPEYRPQSKDRYDYVPTRDVTVPQPPYSRSQTPSYHVTRPGHVDQMQNRYEYVPTHDDGNERHLSSVSANDFEPVSRQDPKDRWKQARFQDEPRARAHSPSATQRESELHPPAYPQPRQNTGRDNNRVAVEFPTSSPESQSYRTSADHRDNNRLENRSSAVPAKASESLAGDRASIRGKYPTYQNEPGFPRSIPSENRGSDYQNERRKSEQIDKEGDHSFSVPAKRSESFSGNKASIRDRYPPYHDEPGFPRSVPSENRGSNYRDGGRKTGQTDEEDIQSSFVSVKASESFSRDRPSIRGRYHDEPGFPRGVPSENRGSDYQNGRRKIGQIEEQGNRPSFVLAKAPDSFSGDRPSVGGRYQDEPGFPRSVPSENRGSDYQDWRRQTGQTDEQSDNSFQPAKAPESFSNDRPSIRGRYQDEPEFPHGVPSENRGSNYPDGRRKTGQTDEQDISRADHRGNTWHENRSSLVPAKAPASVSGVRPSILASDNQNGRRKTGQTDEQDIRGRGYPCSSVSTNKAPSAVSNKRREEKGRRVKFQSDPDLSHKEDSEFRDIQRPSKGGAIHTSRVASDRDQPPQRYQSSESLRGYSGRLSDPEIRGLSESLGGSTGQLSGQEISQFAPNRVAADRQQRMSDRRYQSSESLRGQSSGQEIRELRYSSQTSLLAQGRSTVRHAVQRARSVDRVDRAERTRKLIREPISRSRESSGDRRRNLPKIPAAGDDETSSVMRDVASQIARMTSSVNSIAPEPPERPPADSKGTAGGRTTSNVRDSGQTSANKHSRLRVTINDVDSSSSAQTGLVSRDRLEEQKRKKTEMRQKGLSGGDAELLAQIQDDLQSEITRYTDELDAANRPIIRSVVCEQDPQTSPEVTGNIVNTALIDSQVQIMLRYIILLHYIVLYCIVSVEISC